MGDQAGDERGAGRGELWHFWGIFAFTWGWYFLEKRLPGDGEPLLNWLYTVESDWMADFLVKVRKKMADINCY